MNSHTFAVVFVYVLESTIVNHKTRIPIRGVEYFAARMD